MAHSGVGREVRSAFIGPGDPLWIRFLESIPHDFYHLPSYANLASKYEGGEPVAFYAEVHQNALLLPLLVRPLPEDFGFSKGWTDVASPYGYPGPLIRMHDSETVPLLLRAFRRYAFENNVVSAFIRLHPLLNDTPEMLTELDDIARHGETVYLDLSKPMDEIWGDIRHGHRQDIRKLRRLDFTVEFDCWKRMWGFLDAYRSTMERVSASDFYCFPDSYFHDLREALGDRLHLCIVQAPDGEIASGALFTLVNGIAQNHLAATNDKYLRIAPSKLMTYSQMIWLKSAGARVFHLGGGVSASADSLFDFKAGFSKLRAGFCTCSAIIDEEKYRRLVHAAIGGVGQHQGFFFPAYR